MLPCSKNPYEMLETIPKMSVLNFYVGTMFIGVWHVLKCIVYFLWKWISSVKVQSNCKDGMDYYGGGYHDKPPQCLVDNALGRQLYVKLKGVKFHYIEAGNQSDNLLLLLHGFPDCWIGWNNQIQVLSKYFRVVAVDLKGFNDSDKPISRNSYKPQQICEELSSFIQSLGCHSATIIGHDLGAVIGWIFAHTNPDRVDRFIAVSGPHPNVLWQNLNPDSQMNDNWLKFIQLPMLPENQFAKSDFLEKCLPHIYNGSWTKHPFKDIANDRCMTHAYKYVFNRSVDWTGPLNYYRNFPFFKIREGETIKCPCLIITGSEDTCKLDTIVKSAEYCDNFVLKIIDGTKHWPHQEKSEQFNKILLKFLIGNRAKLDTSTDTVDNQKGIMSRMLGAVSNTVKIGSLMLDSVQQRTSDVINGALPKTNVVCRVLRDILICVTPSRKGCAQ